MTIEEQAIIVFEAKSKHILDEPNKSGYFDGFETSHEQGQFYQKVAELIKRISTADIVEAGHGHWIDEGADLDGEWYYRCSVCGAEVVNGYEFPLCPWCGSRMDEKEQEHG